jgi:hypothetical protein
VFCSSSDLHGGFETGSVLRLVLFGFGRVVGRVFVGVLRRQGEDRRSRSERGSGG